MADVKAEVKDGRIVISLPFNPVGKRSESGKTMIVASTRGAAIINADGFDKPVSVNVNVYFKE